MDDVIIVGSGASAVSAALPLVQAGLCVRMIDVGDQDTSYSGLIPDRSFLDIRKTDSQQHRYFLGDRFEGIPLGKVQVGAQLTPPRQYITRDTEKDLPIDATDFSVVTSLALGGLASGWSAGAMPFGPMEMSDFPISCEDLAPHYEKMAAEIGISGEQDDLTVFDGAMKTLPPLRMDNNAAILLARYQRQRERFNRKGFFMGKPKMAVLTKPYHGRGADRYQDMSFWADTDQSVWRPIYTLTFLQSHPNFSYQRSRLARSFEEHSDGSVELVSTNLESGQSERYQARALVLAAGLFGTTRIVLKSLNQYGVKVPLVCNPYVYYPMVNVSHLGQSPRPESHSLAQLGVVYIPKGNETAPIHGRIHSYRSLLNFKIMKELPFPFREGMRLVQLLAPSLAVLAIDHEDRPSPEKYCLLEKGSFDSVDRLKVVYHLSEDVKRNQLKYEREILSCFWRLGCVPIKRVFPGYGASIRYGGSFPMSRQEKPMTVSTEGLLQSTRSVYLVDGSILPYLPAKGMTFTMMANANRIGEFLCKRVQRG
jgi:hypothetical protein